ncbi:hypothetical protein AB6A40_010742 [Gnathostoma spinigerum]|uniref:Uncharacterized protein n=1 Tax=Gnathostoma spinigerum TaxID=75299 RepID=A0ABD6EW70_9BILA
MQLHHFELSRLLPVSFSGLIQVALAMMQNLPCLYDWAEWSPCSATCTDPTLRQTPTRYRVVINESIARSSGSIYAQCPEPEDLIEIVPCNTYLCPRHLSSYNWSECYLNDPANGASAGCYRIRMLEPEDQLVKIDGNLTVPCSPSECEKVSKWW